MDWIVNWLVRKPFVSASLDLVLGGAVGAIAIAIIMGSTQSLDDQTALFSRLTEIQGTTTRLSVETKWRSRTLYSTARFELTGYANEFVFSMQDRDKLLPNIFGLGKSVLCHVDPEELSATSVHNTVSCIAPTVNGGVVKSLGDDLAGRQFVYGLGVFLCLIVLCFSAYAVFLGLKGFREIQSQK